MRGRCAEGPIPCVSRAWYQADASGRTNLERDPGVSEFERLERWYAAQCDGDWEHEFGVHLSTLDNPGWILRVDLEGTELEGRPFATISDLEPERAWIHCCVKGAKFEAAGGPGMLERMIREFCDWAEASTPT